MVACSDFQRVVAAEGVAVVAGWALAVLRVGLAADWE